MAFSDLYKLVEQTMTNFEHANGRVPPSFGFGAKDAQNVGNDPRITWMPIGGPVASRNANTAPFPPDTNPRSLWMRKFTSAPYIWAPDVDQANELANRLVAALDALFHGGYQITGEKWDCSGDADQGNTIVISFLVELRFLDEKLPITQATSAPITPEIA